MAFEEPSGCPFEMQKALRLFLQVSLWIVFGVFTTLLVGRVLAGRFTSPPFSIRSPLNAESFVAVSFILLLLLGAKPDRASIFIKQRAANFQLKTTTIFFTIFALCLAAFYHSLNKPLLFDDYGHVTLVSQANWREILAAFYKPHVDIFFRPVGFLSYFVDFHWAHFDPFRWHACSLVIHMLNCAFVYALARQLEFSHLPSAVAAAVFAIHGTRAEAVCWTDARFDLLSTLFVLLTLSSLEKYVRLMNKWWLAGAYIFGVLAVFTKEAAFALPLMVIVISMFHGGERCRRMLRTAPGMFALAAAGFIYRLWMIQGIGGYETNGHPNIFTFNAILSAKGLLWRLWALAFFPINWSLQASVAVALLMAIFIGLLAMIAAGRRVNKIRLVGSLLLILVSSLPVEHLLLIGADLAGSRILYLPMLGIALFWAVISETYLDGKFLVYVVAAVVLCFNLGCLEGNIAIWTQVAEIARSACQAFGEQIAKLPGSVQVIGLPAKYRGVYFLENGFANCVQVNSGVPAGRIITFRGSTEVPYIYRWNQDLLRFDAEKKD